MSLHKFVKNASREGVVDGCKYIKRDYLPNNKLLAKSNQLDFNSVNAIKNHFNTDKKYIISEKHLKTYLAASSLVHSINGWSYIAEAISSLMNGDRYIPIHLGYYAELRATMSFLATEGIGIFNYHHLAINSNGTIKKNPTVKKSQWDKSQQRTIYKKVSSSTHHFTWDTLEKWSDPNIDLNTNLLDVFTVRGKSFNDWLNAFHPSASNVMSSAIIKSWLRSWNFDVKSFRNDREMRNEVTYRPQSFFDFCGQVDFKEIISKLSAFWEAISPLLSDRFNLLDKYLLRIFLTNLKDEIENLLGRTINFVDCVNSSLTDLGISDRQLEKFLCYEAPYDNEHVLFEESKINEIAPLPVIARALLMLRVSTGASSQIFLEAEITKDELDFYWQYLGIDNGFWEPQNPPNDFEELWKDIEIFIEDIDNWVQNNNSNLFNLSISNSKEFIYFSQFHRAGFWGLRI